MTMNVGSVMSTSPPLARLPPSVVSVSSGRHRASRSEKRQAWQPAPRQVERLRGKGTRENADRGDVNHDASGGSDKECDESVAVTENAPDAKHRRSGQQGGKKRSLYVIEIGNQADRNEPMERPVIRGSHNAADAERRHRYCDDPEPHRDEEGKHFQNRRHDDDYDLPRWFPQRLQHRSVEIREELHDAEKRQNLHDRHAVHPLG